MTMPTAADTAGLIAQLTEAVRAPSVEATVGGVKRVLEQTFLGGGFGLADRFRRPLPDHYARRLLHRDAKLGYTAIVMTWGPGQRTGLHDHAGMWCVEGVVEGQMEVVQYDQIDEASGTYCFAKRSTVAATVGAAGSLIPPFEYHVLANALPDQTSITLHVYGGEMSSCSLYEPLPDGRYGRHVRALTYDE